MTRVCFLLRRLERGGAERQLVELIRRLPSERFGVALVTFYEGGALAGELAQATHVRVLSLGKRGRWDVLPFLWRALRAINRERPHVVHGWLGMANLLALLTGRLAGARVMWGVRSGYMDLTRYDWLSRIEYGLAARCARFADAAVFNSWAGRAYHERHGYAATRGYVVTNGIDIVRFAPDAEARRSLRREWGVAGDEALVGLVARLDPMKDHDTFLRAVAIVLGQRGDVRVACVGGGPEDARQRLRALAEDLGIASRVRWEGERADVERVYNACDLVVLSSYGEGFPNVLGEALACGTPCVTTDVGDASRVVGEPERVAPPRDPAALAAAMLRALAAEPADREHVRSRVCRDWSAERMALDYGLALEEVAATRDEPGSNER